MRLTRFALALAGVLLVASASVTTAQTYPSRPVTIVVPYPPGGVLDLLAREIGHRLQQSLGQPFVTENRAGASGNIGSALVARAAPDGHTLLLTTSAPLVFNQFTFKDMPFDPLKDFAPIIATSQGSIAVVVHSSVPVGSIAELIAYAKANPGKLSYGSSGTGSPHHLCGEYLRKLAGIDILHVPYRGSAPAMTDLVAGQIPMGFITLGAILPQARAGAVKILAITDDVRSTQTPDIPTVAETIPAYKAAPAAWNGLVAPPGTPAAIISRLNAEINRALADPALREKMPTAGLNPIGGTPEALTARMRAEAEIVGALVREIGLKPE